jgi:hypothetical protein
MRTALLTLHVLVSVGWNGVAFVQLVLASTAPADADLRHSAYELMHVVDRTLDIPLALLTLITGVAMSMKTRWGLLRYWWVVTKLIITVVAVISGGALIRTLIVGTGHATADGAAAYPAQTTAIIICACAMNLLFITHGAVDRETRGPHSSRAPRSPRRRRGTTGPGPPAGAARDPLPDPQPRPRASTHGAGHSARAARAPLSDGRAPGRCRRPTGRGSPGRRRSAR